MKNNWFTSWFDTPYYHMLYKNRDNEEAQFFIRNITEFLSLSKTSHIADIPCGKGRHAIYLNSLGYTVTGGDLSKNSIRFARKFENETLDFQVWDMRKPYSEEYDAIFNLFTSFGYFDNDEDDVLVLEHMKDALTENGVLVLDFLNVDKVAKTLIKKEKKRVDGITFYIEREIKDGFILKHIKFSADKQRYNFTEYVKLLDLTKMQHYFEKAGLKIIHTFGDYSLNKFDKKTSNRLILVAK